MKLVQDRVSRGANIFQYGSTSHDKALKLFISTGSEHVRARIDMQINKSQRPHSRSRIELGVRQ